MQLNTKRKEKEIGIMSSALIHDQEVTITNKICVLGRFELQFFNEHGVFYERSFLQIYLLYT